MKHEDYCSVCMYKEFVNIPETVCSYCVGLIGGHPSQFSHGMEQADFQIHITKDINPKMSPERFKELLDELDDNSLQTLKERNAKYAVDGDCLHNFRSGAEIMGGTPAQACWGYMTKHLVALRDKVMNDDFSDREDFLEKCQDIINYIRFLWCIGNDGENVEIGMDNLDRFNKMSYEIKNDIFAQFNEFGKKFTTDVHDKSIEELNKRVDDALNECAANPKYEREIRVYSKHNGMLYAKITMDNCPDVEVFKDNFVVHGVENCKEFKTLYEFDKFYCVIAEKINGKLKHQIIDKESN